LADARPVGSVTRAIALLDVLAEHPGGLGVNELARRIAVNASTASRLLATLEQGRLVEREAGGPYHLGMRLVTLADGVLERLDVRELARPRLRRLAAETGETATLSVPAESEAVTVDFVRGESSVVSLARIGRPSVAHATAVGKVVLAHGAQAPDTLTAYTPRTITAHDALASEVAATRERGWGDAAGEREPDLNAVAAPVLDRTGALAAVLGVQGPASRLDAQRRAAIAALLLDEARALAAQLQG
jgi:IclR family acetate operon transcriptional repressor